MIAHIKGCRPSRIGFPFGSLATVLFGFSLLFQSCAVFADSIPYAADIGYSGWSIEGDYIADIYPTQDALCQRAMLLRTGFPSAATYTYFTYTVRPVRGDCWYSHPILITGRIIDGWARDLACPRGGLPEDRMAEVPMCSCPPGQKFPPSVVWWKGPWCIPDTTPSCSIDPVPPYTPDPEPVDITAPNFKLGTQLACMQNAIGASNGTSTVNSGYRSAPYNKHLQQVWDKWREFLDAQRPECAAELATAENHKNAHELVARPANSSAHTRGEAFDLSSGLYDGILDVLGFGCGLRRPDPIGDPPHFIRR